MRIALALSSLSSTASSLPCQTTTSAADSVRVLAAAIDTVASRFPRGRLLIDRRVLGRRPLAATSESRDSTTWVQHAPGILERLEQAGYHLATRANMAACHPSWQPGCLDAQGVNRFLEVSAPIITGASASVRVAVTTSEPATASSPSRVRKARGSTTGAMYEITLQRQVSGWRVIRVVTVGQS